MDPTLLHSMTYGLFILSVNAAEKDNACIKCRSCGHNVAGTAAPEIRPVCAHPQSYFELNAENC